MNYLDAIELAYSGAQVIHPKTIKPLQNRNIPLHVRCFLDPALPGSVIRAGVQKNREIPILIVKPSQVLLTVRANDFSFILEERFAQIFALLDEYMVKVNLIQSSAVNLDLCMDRTRHLEELTERLRQEGTIRATIPIWSSLPSATIRLSSSPRWRGRRMSIWCSGRAARCRR